MTPKIATIFFSKVYFDTVVFIRIVAGFDHSS